MEKNTDTPELAQPEQKIQAKHIHRFVLTLLIGVVTVIIAPPYIRAWIWWNIQQHQVLAAFFVLFIVLALSIIWSLGDKLDDFVFVYLNKYGPRTTFADRLMMLWTQVGNGLTSFILAAIFYFIGHRVFSFQLIFGTITLWLVVELCKLLVGRRRPYHTIEAARIVGSKAAGFSFPSGHTSQAFFLVTFFIQSFHFSWYAIVLLYLLAAVTGVTRIYLGAHYPRDVIAGAFLGTLWGYLASVLYGIVTSWIG